MEPTCVYTDVLTHGLFDHVHRRMHWKCSGSSSWLYLIFILCLSFTHGPTTVIAPALRRSNFLEYLLVIDMNELGAVQSAGSGGVAFLLEHSRRKKETATLFLLSYSWLLVQTSWKSFEKASFSSRRSYKTWLAGPGASEFSSCVFAAQILSSGRSAACSCIFASPTATPIISVLSSRNM